MGGVRDRSPGDNVAGRIGNLTATPFLTEKVVASEGLGLVLTSALLPVTKARREVR